VIQLAAAGSQHCCGMPFAGNESDIQQLKRLHTQENVDIDNKQYQMPYR
jgi:hypothetical protein